MRIIEGSPSKVFKKQGVIIINKKLVKVINIKINIWKSYWVSNKLIFNTLYSIVNNKIIYNSYYIYL